MDIALNASKNTPFRLRDWMVSDRVLGTMTGWLVILLSCGYPLSASLAMFLKVPSTPINFTARLIYMMMALYLISASYFRKETRSITIGGLCIILFWVIYLIRAVYDLEVVGVQVLATSSFNFYSFSVGNCFLPSVAIVLTARYISLPQWPWKVWVTLLVVNILMLILIQQMAGELSMKIFTNRLSIGSKDGKESVINPILISFYGGQLVVTSIGLSVFFKKSSLLKRLLLLISLLIGLSCLFLGASRSPIIITSLIILFMFFFYLKEEIKMNLRSFIKILTIFSVFTIGINYISSKYEVKDFLIIERLLRFSKDRSVGKKETRDFEQSAAINDFLNNPIAGRSIVNSYDNTYPHNIVIEVMMAIGLIGLIIFLPIFYLLVYRSFVLPFYYPSIIIYSMFIVMTYLLVFFSDCIWSSTNFWAVSAMLLCLQKRQFS
jgi:O-Antigen ligase